MRVHYCKCGKCTYYESGMYPQDCQGCKECGTNYRKEPLKKHTWKKMYNENTGKPYKICKICYTIHDKSYQKANKK